MSTYSTHYVLLAFISLPLIECAAHAYRSMAGMKLIVVSHRIFAIQCAKAIPASI